MRGRPRLTIGATDRELRSGNARTTDIGRTDPGNRNNRYNPPRIGPRSPSWGLGDKIECGLRRLR